MKKRILIYFLVFSVLLIIFQYVNAKRTLDALNKKAQDFRALSLSYKDSILVLQKQLSEATHFNLENNEDAISYFEADDHRIEALIPLIKNELYELNEVRGQHPVIPYAASEGRKMLINTVKILNHKWIIADFTDGEYWGEALIEYAVNKNETVDFELMGSFLYPFD